MGEANGVVSFGDSRVHERVTLEGFVHDPAGGLIFYDVGFTPTSVEILEKVTVTSAAPPFSKLWTGRRCRWSTSSAGRPSDAPGSNSSRSSSFAAFKRGGSSSSISSSCVRAPDVRAPAAVGSPLAVELSFAQRGSGPCSNSRLSSPRAPGGRYEGSWTRSRSGSMPQRAADLGELAVERPAVGAGRPLVFEARALQRHAAGVVADRAHLGDLDSLSRAAVASELASAASSARLSSIGRASEPLSWISVGATQRTGGLREVPEAGELQRREAVALGVGAHPLEPARGPPAPTLGPEAAVVVRAKAWPGSTSSWNRPP